MLRRRLSSATAAAVVGASLLGASIVGVAAFATLAPSSGPLAPAATSGLSDPRPVASIAEAPQATVDAPALERTERFTEAGRGDGRSSGRQHRIAEWAVALVGGAALVALVTSLARRRTGHAAVRSGRVAPARAPPFALSST